MEYASAGSGFVLFAIVGPGCITVIERGLVVEEDLRGTFCQVPFKARGANLSLVAIERGGKQRDQFWAVELDHDFAFLDACCTSEQLELCRRVRRRPGNWNVFRPMLRRD